MRRSLFFAIFFIFLFLNSKQVLAFKMKAHVYIADQTRETILKGNTISFDGPDYLKNIPINNDEVLEAIRKYPAYYRAGAIGPDGFPDMIEGQIQTHVDLGEKKGVENGVPFEQRRFSELRSVDHFMIMLREAHKLPLGEERLQALAFTYGFATHMTTDGFAHEFLNEWTWGCFDFTNGQGLFGPITEEIKHMAAESYFEHFIPERKNLDELTLKIPSNFLYHVFTMPVYGLKENAPAGSEGGVFYRNLLKAQKVLKAFAGKTNKEVGLDHENYELIQNLRREIGEQTKSIGDEDKKGVISDLEKELQLGDDEAERGLLGGGKDDVDLNLKSIGKLLIEALKGMHLQQFFVARSDLIDIFMHKWLEVNLCVNQNLLWATNLSPDEKLDHDACGDIDFEDTPEIQNIFHGKLNKAVWQIGSDRQFHSFLDRHKHQGSLPFRSHSPKDSKGHNLKVAAQMARQHLIKREGPNYGSLALNLQKLMEFVGTFAERGFKFHPLQDIKGLQPLNEIVAKCKRAKYGNSKKKSFDDSEWKDVLDPDIDDIDQINFDMQITDKGFSSIIHGASMAVTWGACKAITKAHDQLSELKDMVNRQIDKVINKIKLKLLERFYQTEYGKVLLAFKELHDLKNMNGPAMFVNVAFLAEDLRHNPKYLNQILKKSLNIRNEILNQSLPLETAVNDAYEKTKDKGSELVGRIFSDLDKQQTLLTWKGLLRMLISLVQGKNITDAQASWGQALFVSDEGTESQEKVKNWINSNSPTGKKSFRLPFSDQMAKILRVINNMQILLEVRGTAIHSIRENMALPPEVPGNDEFYDLDVGTKKFVDVDLNKFYPMKNALTMAKLTLFGKKGIYELLRRKNPHLKISDIDLGASQICKDHPFMVCDTMQSLDDPNGYGKMAPADALYPSDRILDVNRSLSIWEASQTKWPENPLSLEKMLKDVATPFSLISTNEYARRFGECRLALTNFVLANNWSVVKDYYLELFDLPPGCLENFMMEQ